MLEGKTAFVTGGSGAVGAAVVRCMAGHGARVAFSYHSQPAKALALQEELCAAGFGVRSYPLDVLNGAEAQQLAATIEQDLGPVDILVNNAGLTQVMPFALIEEEHWDLMMNVNVKGMFLVTKAFVRPMIRRQRGAIVNLGSLAGVRVLEVPVHYATAKSAVMGFTLSLAREMARYHIRVNAVVPGLLTDGVSDMCPTSSASITNNIARWAGPAPRRRWPNWSPSSPATAPPISMPRQSKWTVAYEIPLRGPHHILASP